MRRVLAVLCLVLIAALGSSAAAQDGVREAALLLRILSYDRNLLERRHVERVVVLIIAQPGNAASEAERQRIVAAVNQLGSRMTVANMAASATPHAYRDRATLTEAVRSTGATAVYVCAGLGGEVSTIAQAGRELHVLTLTSQADGVRAGLGVGLIADGSQVRLLVNLPAVEGVGARLDASVLRLAEVIR